jgi:hypothetical protein
MVGTNVYCALCEKEVGKDDSFVVENPDVVQAFHIVCGEQIRAAMHKAMEPARGQRKIAHSATTEWRLREIEERLDATEDLTKRTAAVWKLWLSEAGSGSINPGTFDAMRNLLGIEKA